MAEIFHGIEHVGLAAHDPERLAQWYQQALGFSIAKVFDNGPGKPRAFFVALPDGSMLEIYGGDTGVALRARANVEPGLAHLAILVTDFDAAMAHLEARKAQADGEARSGPNGARLRFYRDPEGNLIHLIYRPHGL